MPKECPACTISCKNKLHEKMLACGQCECGEHCQNCDVFMLPLVTKANRPDHNIYPCLNCGFVPA
jgi:hypothetical protein